MAQLPAYVLPSWAYQLCKWTTLVLGALVGVSQVGGAISMRKAA